MPVTSATSRRTAPLFATRTKPACRTPPSGVRRNASARTGKFPSACWLRTVKTASPPAAVATVALPRRISTVSPSLP